MPFSTDNPQLGFYTSTIESTIPGLTFPWTTATQEVDSTNGSIVYRSFNELEITTNTTWAVGQGKLATEESNVHYIALTKMYAHSYSGSKEHYDDLEPMSNFNGWQYRVEDYNLVGKYQDNLVKTIVWSIYDVATSDELLITDSSGDIDNQSGNVSDLTINVPTRGVGYRASADSGFTVVSDTTNLLATGLTSSPQVLRSNVLSITRPDVQRSILVGQQTPTLLASITIELYGTYWSQVPDLIEIYDQGWVVHEETETNKLKPPGKSGLNDSFPVQVVGVPGLSTTQV